MTYTKGVGNKKMSKAAEISKQMTFKEPYKRYTPAQSDPGCGRKGRPGVARGWYTWGTLAWAPVTSVRPLATPPGSSQPITG